MKNQWMSVKDITQIKGMPSSGPGVHKKAKREGWESRRQEGVQGSGVEYLVTNYDLVSENTQTYDSSPKSEANEKPIPNKFIEAYQYDLKASAGSGCLVVSENPVAKFEFSEDWLNKQGLRGKQLAVVPVSGDSMEATLIDEDLMLVELVTDPKHARDGICVIRIDDEILVKRLQYDYATNGYHVSSDNRAYKPFFVGEEFNGRFAVLGKMIRVLQRAKQID